MIFGSKELKKFSINEKKLAQVDMYKYLGTIFLKVGPVFNDNVECLLNSSVRAKYYIRCITTADVLVRCHQFCL